MVVSRIGRILRTACNSVILRQRRDGGRAAGVARPAFPDLAEAHAQARRYRPCRTWPFSEPGARAGGDRGGAGVGRRRRLRKPSEGVAPGALIEARAAHPWASRGGVKLAGGARRVRARSAGRDCLDIGASTGGFTDVLLTHGARARHRGRCRPRPACAAPARGPSRDRPRRARRARPRRRSPRSAAERDRRATSASFRCGWCCRACLPLAAPEAWLVALIKPQFEAGRGPYRQGRGARTRRFTRRSARRSKPARRGSAGPASGSFPRRSPAAAARRNSCSPRVMDEPAVEELSIDGLGDRGEGLARSAHGPLAIPGALPGERVLARIDGARGRLVDILSRRAPTASRRFARISAIAAAARRSTAAASLRRLEARACSPPRSPGRASTAAVGPLVDAHGEGRRRATFHARLAPGRAGVEAGFMRARAHDIVEIDDLSRCSRPAWPARWRRRGRLPKPARRRQAARHQRHRDADRPRRRPQGLRRARLCDAPGVDRRGGPVGSRPAFQSWRRP